MELIKSDKTVSKQIIQGKEEFKVKLSLESEPNIINHPKEIALLLDESGSMNGAPLMALKWGVHRFIDVINRSTQGIINTTIGNGSRIGLVEFSSKANILLPLTDSVQELKKKTNSLRSNGSTNHKDAFLKGMEVLDQAIVQDKVMIIFTDGQSNQGYEGFAEANAAKAKGYTIYCIGFGEPARLDVEAMKKWVSAPVDEHILVAPTLDEIGDKFEDLAVTITEPKATNVTLIDKVSPCFDVVSVEIPTKGTAVILDDKSVMWTVENIGGKGKETICAEFTVRHTGDCIGVQPVNESFSYTDNENNYINLPEPTIEIINATGGGYEEGCGEEREVTSDPCSDLIVLDAGQITMENLGRILETNITIKNVCPNRDVALAIIVSELDATGNSYSRGMKTMLIPAHTGTTCRDVEIKCIKFVLPEALDITGDPTSLCNERKFKVNYIVNYIDTDYICCQGN